MLDARLPSISSSSSSCSSSSSSSSSRPVSPLETSVQTFMRVPVEGEPQQHTRARGGSTSLSSSSAHAHAHGLRPGGLMQQQQQTHARGHSSHSHSHSKARRLTTDVLSPTGSSSSSAAAAASPHFAAGHDRSSSSDSAYGARNLATVGCRKSASIVTAATAAAAADSQPQRQQQPQQQHRNRRTAGSASSSSSSSSSLLGKLKDGSLEVLARFGVVTPPSPKSYTRPAISSKTQAHVLLPPPPVLLLPSPQQAHGRHASSGSSSSQGRAIVTHELARLSLATHQRHASGASLSSSSASDGRDPPARFSHATECVRTALGVIIARLQTAQAQGAAAELQEARTLVEGGGIDALLRGLQTLGGHDPAVARNLLYVLRVVVLDPTARRAAAAGAKGRMLMEQVPAVLRAHAAGSPLAVQSPIVADGLAVMAAWLGDPVTREAAVPLLLTPEALALVRAVHAQAGGQEVGLCAEVLKHAGAAAGEKDGQQPRLACRAD